MNTSPTPRATTALENCPTCMQPHPCRCGAPNHPHLNGWSTP